MMPERQLPKRRGHAAVTVFIRSQQANREGTFGELPHVVRIQILQRASDLVQYGDGHKRIKPLWAAGRAILMARCGPQPTNYSVHFFEGV